jgi:hypothetical protein
MTPGIVQTPIVIQDTTPTQTITKVISHFRTKKAMPQPLVLSPLKHSNPLLPCLSNPSTKPSHFRLSSSASRSARHLTHSSTLMFFSSSLKPPAARANCTARDPGVAWGDASSIASRSTASQGIEEVMRVFCLEGERDLPGER